MRGNPPRTDKIIFKLDLDGRTERFAESLFGKAIV